MLKFGNAEFWPPAGSPAPVGIAFTNYST